MKRCNQEHPVPVVGGLAAVLMSIGLSAALAQPKPLEGLPEKLGKVDFPISCNAAAQAPFTRGVALYHSYYWPEARKSFAAVLAADPGCAMAHWGEAIVTMGNAFAWPLRGRALTDGAAAIERAKALGGKTQRERDYITAADAFYAGADKVPARTRQLAYELVLEKMTRDYPNDYEAVIFHAHDVSANYDPNDKGYANQLRAAATLEKLYLELPEHPGVAHYLIHSYDFPSLAQRGLNAALRYRTVAPSAPHALHMPSHTFTRLGMWQDSISSNQSVLAVTKDMVSRLHSLDYMAYAHLQLGQDHAADALYAEIRAITGKIESDGLFAAAYALAAIPARVAIERARWADAARLELTPDELSFGWDVFPQARAIHVFARGLGAARSGDTEAARREIGQLRKLRQDMVDGGIRYWVDQTDIQIDVVQAWVLNGEGKPDEALRLMRAAADHEDATDKSAVTPGPIKPARELLGEMLVQSGRAADALVEFEIAMKKEPGRFRALLGAARAAETAGNTSKTRSYYERLARQWEGADGDSAELARVKQALLARP